MATSSSETTSINWEKKFHQYETIIAGNDDSLRVQATLKLAQISKHAPESALVSAVPVLVELLRTPYDNQTPSISIQQAAAQSLKCIACLGEGRLALIIGQCGAIPPLMSLLQTSESGLQKVILKCLRNLVTFNDSNRSIVARNGGLEMILDMLDAGSDELKRPLLEILSALSLLREVRRDVFNSGHTRFLVECARIGSKISRTRAAQGIGLLGLVKKARVDLVCLGAMEALMEIISDGNNSGKLVASNSLGIISSHVDYMRPVTRAGVISKYAEILEGCDPMGKEIAEDVFCIFSMVEETGVEIFQHLVRILRGSNNEAKAAAADIVWTLAGYKHLDSVLQNSGIIPVLVELLGNSPSEGVKEMVTGAVAQLSWDKAARTALADSGAIRILMELVEGEGDHSEDMRENAAAALVRFSEDPSTRDRVSCDLNSPLLQEVQRRLMQMRASGAEWDPSFTHMSVQHLTGTSYSAS